MSHPSGEWLATTNFSSFESPDDDTATKIEGFVNKELILFAYADNQRSIPSAIDGLKPSQRKVLSIPSSIPLYPSLLAWA